MIVAASLYSTAAVSPYHAVRYLMGTWCDLSIFDVRAEHAAPTAEAVFEEIARLERVMSTWDADAELSRVNRRAGRGLQPISRDLAEVTAAALDTCRDTGGAFDPTVGPLVRLWRFDTEHPTMPSLESVAQARLRVGCSRIALEREPPSLALPNGSSVDLGGIGKGYAVDRALAVLRSAGVRRAKLDCGSSSLGFEGRTDGGWPVVVADPRDRERPLLTFRVERGSVSSSGQQERMVSKGGRRYGHIFDPRTGQPVESALLLVTVVAPDATRADALSTALFVLGPDPGERLLRRMPDVSAIFVETSAAGRLSVRTVGRIYGFALLSSSARVPMG
jgi:thiamine biosynthesis lipoprotein